ncbi:hypothetical protein DAI22_01g148000 [Oryza sativa Japonica Group]|uniref:Uncharacterized protein n=3 Tax=Oryza TaxID=4527 RepID=A0A0E0MVF5_ORYRU|nr:gametogenetin [Oryza sativa Japonica Group]KAF2949863.1 hypothetical protein DAI22_01g148000 [Oryza sativa Japonica Group]
MRSTPRCAPFPNPNPNPDASPPPSSPMTPRAPSMRHHPPHLYLAEVVASWHPFHKKPCLSDRSTAPPSAHFADAPETQTQTPTPPLSASGGGGGGSFRWLGPRKRRRRGAGSRSVSGRSSDRRRSGTCSDFHVTCGAGGGGATDSSGEMWASDVGEVRMRDVPMATEFGPAAPVGGAGSGSGGTGAAAEVAAADSGYGSEPGYRGDVELGYGDEIDEEEEDGRQQLFFWGEEIGDCIADMNKMGIVGDNNFGEQKSHHRCRRKKHDVRMLDP